MSSNDSQSALDMATNFNCSSIGFSLFSSSLYRDTGGCPTRVRSEMSIFSRIFLCPHRVNTVISINGLRAIELLINRTPPNSHAVIYSDSQPAIGMVKNDHTRSSACSLLVAKIHKKIEKKSLMMQLRYVSTTDNVYADFLSRIRWTDAVRRKIRPKT
jgi:hypothetical protein